MKFIFKFLLVVVVCAVCTGLTTPSPPSKLVKAFDALRIHNYFAAKDLFYKTMKKDTVASSYGLSVIYGRNNNPFYNLDSAFKFVQISAEAETRTVDEKWSDLAMLPLDSSLISRQISHVDSCFFVLILADPSIESWNTFIDIHAAQPFNSDAVSRRNSLAFSEAEALSTSNAYLIFMNRYPEATEKPEARLRYEMRLYEESVKGDALGSYQDFIAIYPESPYRNEAELKVYDLSTADGKVESYYAFIHANPENPSISRAWRMVYTLEVSELSTETLAAFSLKYPDYPFMDEVNLEFEAVTTRYYPIKCDEKWGFIDESGAVQVPCQYDWVDSYSENLAAVGIGDEVMFINKKGDRVIDLELEDAYSFHMGYVVGMLDGRTGVLNRLGEWVIQPEYDEVGEFSEGLFYASKNDLYGFLDQSGEEVISFKYLNATDFKNGGAVVENAEGMGVVNISDVPLTSFGYTWVEPFSETGNPSRFKVNEKFGLLSQTGRILVPAIYDRIGDWSDTLALASNKGKYGFIDFKGDTIIDFKYSYSTKAYSKSKFEGQYVKVYQGANVGIIDTTGEKIFPAIFEDIGHFDDVLVPVKKRGMWGYADLDVNLAIPYRYDQAGSFVDSSAVIVLNGKFGTINRNGKAVIQPTYVSMERYSIIFAVSDTAFGLIDYTGVELTPQVYSGIKVLDHQVLRLDKKNGTQDYYDYVEHKFVWRTSLSETSEE